MEWGRDGGGKVSRVEGEEEKAECEEMRVRM